MRGIPAFFSDAFTCYLAALMACFHTVTTFPRTGKRGRPRQPVITPHPELVYGQLVKEKKQGKLVTISTRVLLGAERFTQCGLGISTALVERLNLTLRQALPRWSAKPPASARTVCRCAVGWIFLSSVLQRRQATHEFAHPVANASMQAPGSNSSAMYGAHTCDGGGPD